MQISKTENVIFLKEVESNIIDQAFIILKNNVKLDFVNTNKAEKNKNSINIVKDAENVINYELENHNLKFEKFKCEILNRKIKILKTTNIITIMLVIFLILIR